jgi:hypothetical protein
MLARQAVAGCTQAIVDLHIYMQANLPNPQQADILTKVLINKQRQLDGTRGYYAELYAYAGNNGANQLVFLSSYEKAMNIAGQFKFNQQQFGGVGWPSADFTVDFNVFESSKTSFYWSCLCYKVDYSVTEACQTNPCIYYQAPYWTTQKSARGTLSAKNAYIGNFKCLAYD